jgi:hypothetical protein
MLEGASLLQLTEKALARGARLMQGNKTTKWNAAKQTVKKQSKDPTNN